MYNLKMKAKTLIYLQKHKLTCLEDLYDAVDAAHEQTKESPSSKAAFVLHIGLLIFILCILQILHKRLLPSESYGTMLRFFMGGRWMRGFNLFSLCGILLLFSFAYLINVSCSLLTRLTDNVVSDNGETVIRLFYSFVR